MNESELTLLNKIHEETSSNAAVLNNVNSDQKLLTGQLVDIGKKVDNIEVDVRGLNSKLNDTDKRTERALTLIEVNEKTVVELKQKQDKDKDIIHQSIRRGDDETRKHMDNVETQMLIRFDKLRTDLPVMITSAIETSGLKTQNWTMYRFIVILGLLAAMALQIVGLLTK